MHLQRENKGRSYRVCDLQILHSAHSLKLDPQAIRCGFWDLHEEDPGTGLDPPNHTILGSDQIIHLSNNNHIMNHITLNINQLSGTVVSATFFVS